MLLPIKDIEDSLKDKGAVVYNALWNDEIVGGAIINIDKETKHNYLDFLYVKVGNQGKGIGQLI